ncbi:MAG: hypothetical protein K6E33_00185, partial [Lachnospiraceae bacterium]|nr:hypothetical protein [Lachnospiraceae bacterium]
MENKNRFKKRISAIIALCLVFIMAIGVMAEAAYAYDLNYYVDISSIKNSDGSTFTMDSTKGNTVTVAAGSNSDTNNIKITSGKYYSEGTIKDVSDTSVTLNLSAIVNGVNASATGTPVTYTYTQGSTATFSGVDLTVPVGGLVFQSIVTPSSVSVNSGTSVANIIKKLPSTVDIKIKDSSTGTESTTSASVTWSTGSSSELYTKYSTTSDDAQTISLTGEVTLPNGVTNPSSVSTSTSIQVNVAAFSIDNISMNSATYSNKQSSSNSDYIEVKPSGLSDKAKAIIKYNYENNSDVKSFIKNNKAETFKLIMYIEGDSDNIDSSAKSRIDDYRSDKYSGYTQGKYFDITLYLTAGDNKIQITNTGSDNDIKLTITVPSDLKKSKRSFRMLKDHDSSVSSVDDVNGTGSSFSYSTHKFSAHSLIYTDSSS